MIHRIAGRLLVLAGVAVLGYVGARYVGGGLARERVRAEWARIEAQQARLDANSRASLVSTGPVAAGTPVARLLVPRIALDEIVVEGVDAGELDVSPGHMPQTPLPGVAGNAVISAHRDMHFRRLGQLRIGDTLTTITPARTVTWRITGRRIVAADAPSILQTTGPTLTLTTCWPISYIGRAPDRLLLTAQPVDAARPPAAALTASLEPLR